MIVGIAVHCLRPNHVGHWLRWGRATQCNTMQNATQLDGESNGNSMLAQTRVWNNMIRNMWRRNTLPGRLELPTLRLTASRSNQLSYGSRCHQYRNVCLWRVNRRQALAACKLVLHDLCHGIAVAVGVCVCVYVFVRIPFGDHPIQLGRYRED